MRTRGLRTRAATQRALARNAAFGALVSILTWSAPIRGDEAFDARLKTLETELRCLVCQNQTLAESNAPLAEDLRREVRELAVAGKSDDDIRAYLVARYGDFVLYKPPVKSTTYALWFGPFVLLALGLCVWLAVLRRRARAGSDAGGSAAAVTVPAADAARARALLEDEVRQKK